MEITYGVATSSSSDVYIVGSWWSESVDFDPGAGTDIHTKEPVIRYSYLTVFDQEGEHQWARTWGQCEVQDIELNEINDSVSVTGIFSGEVDFDPGSGSDVHSSALIDGYLSRFNLEGEYQWVRTWGDYSESYIIVGSCTSDNFGNTYISGSFHGQADFDPGPEEYILTSDGLALDTYLTKFLIDGYW